MTILLSIDVLSQITGGQKAAAPAADPSIEDRVNAAVREELDFREKEDLRDYERNHRFTSFMCQGDRECLRDARRR